MRKLFSPLKVVLILLPLLFPFGAQAYTLPDIPGFLGGEIKNTPLSAPSGLFGEWLVRTYSTGGGRSMKASLLAGPGAGPLFTGQEGVKKNDRPLGFGSTYETFTLDGKKAVLEEVPSVGLSLALAMGENATLTLESPSLSRQDLERAAEAIMGAQK